MIELLEVSKLSTVVNIAFIVLIFLILIELVIYLFLKIWRL